MAWTEEQKKELIERYQESEPTPETSPEIVKQLAEEFEQTANGVRIILVQAGVYVKKEVVASGSKSGEGKKEGSKRVSKESQIEALKAAIQKIGAEVDDEIVEKLTGKAAAYFVQVLNTK